MKVLVVVPDLKEGAGTYDGSAETYDIVPTTKRAITKMGNAVAGAVPYDVVIVSENCQQKDLESFVAVVKGLHNLKYVTVLLMQFDEDGKANLAAVKKEYSGVVIAPLHQACIKKLWLEVVSFKDKKILLADDNRVNQEMARQILENFDCQLCVASNGKEAIEFVESGSFDLIFMDCEMPVMNGFEAARWIEAYFTRNTAVVCPVIAFTAHDTLEVRRKCMGAGMQDLLCKPFEPGAFASMLSKWLTPLL